jgi:hypothetical protein
VIWDRKKTAEEPKRLREANSNLTPRLEIAGSNPVAHRRIRRASLETLGMMGRYSRAFGDVRGIGTAEGPQRRGPRDRKDVRLRPQIAQDEFQSSCPAFQNLECVGSVSCQVPIRAVLCRWPTGISRSLGARRIYPLPTLMQSRLQSGPSSPAACTVPRTAHDVEPGEEPTCPSRAASTTVGRSRVLHNSCGAVRGFRAGARLLEHAPRDKVRDAFLDGSIPGLLLDFRLHFL